MVLPKAIVSCLVWLQLEIKFFLNKILSIEFDKWDNIEARIRNAMKEIIRL